MHRLGCCGGKMGLRCQRSLWLDGERVQGAQGPQRAQRFPVPWRVNCTTCWLLSTLPPPRTLFHFACALCGNTQ